MGAELYINSEFEKSYQKHAPQFAAWAHKFEQAVNGRRAQYRKKMWKHYDKIFAEGSYRDCYDERNLLWKLGLDYGEWFAAHLDQDRQLHPDKAEMILKEVLDRRDRLEEIEDKEEREYFEGKFEQLTEFLRTAIGLGEPIECSI